MPLWYDEGMRLPHLQFRLRTLFVLTAIAGFFSWLIPSLIRICQAERRHQERLSEITGHYALNESLEASSLESNAVLMVGALAIIIASVWWGCWMASRSNKRFQ